MDAAMAFLVVVGFLGGISRETWCHHPTSAWRLADGAWALYRSVLRLSFVSWAREGRVVSALKALKARE